MNTDLHFTNIGLPFMAGIFLLILRDFKNTSSTPSADCLKTIDKKNSFKKYIHQHRSSRPKVQLKKSILKIKNFIKQRLQQKWFHVDFAKFLRTCRIIYFVENLRTVASVNSFYFCCVDYSFLYVAYIFQAYY